jgi:hypothetical protein
MIGPVAHRQTEQGVPDHQAGMVVGDMGELETSGRVTDGVDAAIRDRPLVRYSDNGSTLSAVNFPEVSLPEQPGGHRLLHIHHNVPGVLSRINDVFADNGINISGQYLMTNAKIGYVVIDVEADSSRIALKKLAAIEGTIRTRVLF